MITTLNELSEKVKENLLTNGIADDIIPVIAEGVVSIIQEEWDKFLEEVEEELSEWKEKTKAEILDEIRKEKTNIKFEKITERDVIKEIHHHIPVYYRYNQVETDGGFRVTC